MSRLRQLHHFWQRPWADQWLFVQAYFGLGMAWMALHTLPFRYIAARLGVCMGNSPDVITPAQAEVARRVSWAVRRASGLTPWPSVCLPQAGHDGQRPIAPARDHQHAVSRRRVE